MVNYSADSLAKLWHVEGQGVTQFARYVDTLGKRCLRINMKQKMDFTGLWFDLFRLPLELDVTNAPYMSYEIMSPNVNPLVTLAYFWDADSVRNLNGGKMVMDTITNTTAFSNVFLDFRLPDYLNGPSGVPINTSRIITVLLNYHLKQLSWPNTFIDGVVYISNIRIGDSCKSIPAITPVCTINPVPTQVVWAGSGQQTVELSGISNGKGNTTGVTMQVLSSKVAFVPAPTLSTLGADGKVTLTYTPGSTIDSSTIVLRVNATGSLQKEIRFQIKSASDLSSSAISINVDATVKGQTITGFGAMDVPDMLLDQYVKDQGCTMMRITYGEGVEIVNDNYSPAILDRSAINKNELNLDYIRSASAAGVTDFFVTLWSPPGWMKQNCSFVGGDYASYDWPNNKNKVDPIYYDEYVEYMVSIIRMVKEETGVEIAGFCPQNEPGFVEPYGSGILDPQHMAQVCGMLGKRLSSEGFNTKVINSEQVFTQGLWPVTQYAAAVKSDTLASKYNKVIAMHYPNDDAAAWAAQWSAVKSANQEFWATECTSEGNNFTNIIFQCKAMIQGFNNGCSAWIIWGYNNGSSGTETDMSKKSGMTFSLGKSIHYHAFKNIAKYVKKGSVQLKSTSGNTSIKVAAFKHDGDSTMTILLLNTDSKMPFSVKLTGSAPANGYEAYRTSFYEHCEKVNPFSGNVIVLPPLSFTTLYIKTNVNHAPSIDQVTDKFMPKNGSSTVNLTGISCGDPSNQSITVTAISSDPSVIPNPVVTYTSPATTGSLAIAPLTDKWGEITITVILKDNGGIAKGGVDTTRMSFKVTIPSSLNDLSDKVSIYPNPVAENLNIAVPSDLASATILITNASGQMVMERKLNHEELIEINVSSLPAGAYMVKIADSKNQARLNFSKK